MRDFTAKRDYTNDLVDGCPPEMADALKSLRCLISDVNTFDWRGPKVELSGRNVADFLEQEERQRKFQTEVHANNIKTLQSLSSGVFNNFLNFTRFLNSDEIECCIKYGNVNEQSFDVVARRLGIVRAIKFFEHTDKIPRHVIETAKMTQL